MARRKKHAKKHHRKRRHRMSGVPKGALMSSVGIIAGAIVGRLVAKKVLPSVDEKIKNAGVIAIGALLMPKVIKSELGRSIGQGMIASGGMGLASAFLPAIAGAGDYIDFPVQVGEIDDNLSVIAGDESVMAGDDSSVMAGDDSLSLIAGDEDFEDYDY
jgi:hypothetical protein